MRSSVRSQSTGRNNRTTSSAAAGLSGWPPLTTGGENIHEAIHNLAHDHCAFVAAAPAWRDQRFDQLPFVVGEVAGIAQMAAVIPRAIFVRPHRRPLRIRPPLLNHK